MGIRYLLLGVVLWLVYRAIRRYIWQRKREQSARQARQAMNMVVCDYCGVHLPQDEAIRQGERYYCCKDHSKPGNRTNNNEEQE